MRKRLEEGPTKQSQTALEGWPYQLSAAEQGSVSLLLDINTVVSVELTTEISKKQHELPPLKTLLPLCVRNHFNLCFVNSIQSRLYREVSHGRILICSILGHWAGKLPESLLQGLTTLRCLEILPPSSDFILNITLKRHTFLVCVLYGLHEIGMPEEWFPCDSAVVWARSSYESLT